MNHRRFRERVQHEVRNKIWSPTQSERFSKLTHLYEITLPKVDTMGTPKYCSDEKDRLVNELSYFVEAMTISQELKNYQTQIHDVLELYSDDLIIRTEMFRFVAFLNSDMLVDPILFKLATGCVIREVKEPSKFVYWLNCVTTETLL